MFGLSFKKAIFGAVLIQIFLCLNHVGVYAQTVDSILRNERQDFDERVGIRNIPEEYSNQGFNYKGFQIRSEILKQIRYNDNIFAEESNTDDDFVLNVRPTVTITKGYGSLDLAARGTVNIEKFKSFKDDDKEEFFAEFGGDYELNSKWSIPFNARYSQSFRERGNPQNASVLEKPTAIEQISSSIGLVRRFNRLSVELIGKYNSIEFDDGISQLNQNTVVFRDNNRTSSGANLRFSYLFPRNITGKSGHLVFLDLDAQKQKFENRRFVNGGFNGAKRDNTTLNAVLGFSTSYKGLIEASLGAGYLTRNYDSNALDKLNSFDFVGEVKYAYSPKIVFDLKADRFLTQSSDTQTGIIETEFSAGMDYEIYHNLFWRNRLSYKNFEFSDIKREDDDYQFNSNLRYYLNRNFYSQLGFSYQDRNSNIQDREFDRSIISLSLTSQL